MTPIFKAKVRKGQIFLKDPGKFKKFLLGFKNNAAVKVTVKKDEPTISDPHRKYYFKVLMGLLAKHTGHSKDECHWAMKVKFSSEEVDGMLIIKSVFSNESELTISQKNDFIAEVKQFMWDFHEIIIPEKGEVDYD